MSVKKCSQCGVVKALTEYHKDKRKKLGVRPYCKDCKSKTAAKWYQNNRETQIAGARKWQAENPEAYQRNEKNKRINNPEVYRAIGSKRRAAKLQRTAAWADKDAIKAIYAEAQRLQEALGIPMHVDHVLPLQGELVCGLHVETNLQVIPAALNVRKSNKFKVQ
tara:strand:- start:76 stop:567 length:492 start_codon:yes stop_codon:yes gene_type:complete